MTKNPSRKLPKVFVLIILLVIRIHIEEWEMVVCHPRARRGVKTPVKILKVIDTVPFQSIKNLSFRALHSQYDTSSKDI